MPELAVAIAIIAAVSAIVSAGIAAYAAVRTNQASIANQRVIELEKRLATSRLDVYKPMLEALAAVLDPQKKNESEQQRNKRVIPVVTSFATWIQIYGSDDSVRVFHRFMQAAYHNAPAEVFMRLYAQMVLAARRDLGDANTTVDEVDLLGIRIKDIYASSATDYRLPDSEYYQKVGWAPPWPVSS